MPLQITADVAATKLVTGSDTILADAVVAATLGERSIATAVKDAYLNGFSNKVENYFDYGDEHFFYGLPNSAETYSLEVDIDALQAVLESIFYVNITIESATLSGAKGKFLAAEAIQQSADFDYYVETDRFVEIATGQSRYLAAGEIQGSNVVALSTIDVQSSRPNKGFSFPITDGTTSSDIIYHVVWYLTHDPDKQKNFWHYNPDGTYPTLDPDPNAAIGNIFYPIVPLRQQNININEYASKNFIAKDVKRMLQLLDLDMEDMVEALTDPDSETTIDDLYSAYVMFAMDMNSTEDITLRFLYEHFRTLMGTSPVSQQDWLNDNNKENLITISDGGFHTELKFNFITLREQTGVVTDSHSVPSVNTTFLTGQDATLDQNNTGVGLVTREIVIGVNNSGYSTHLVVYRKQLTPTTFAECIISGLRHKSYVYPNNYVTRDIDGMSDGGFFIPMSRDIVVKFNGIDQNLIYYEGLQLILYVVDISNVPWYKSVSFIKFVGLVLTVIGLSTGLGDLAALFAQGFEVAVYNIVKGYVISEFIVIALEIVVEIIGGDLALLIAAVAAAYAFKTGNDATKILNDLLTSEELLKASTLLIEATNRVTKDEFLKIQEDLEEFLKDAREVQDEIDAANDLLDNGLTFNLYDLIANQGYTDFTETPSGFYNRTIHNNNSGVATNTAISIWVAGTLSLDLPPSMGFFT